MTGTVALAAPADRDRGAAVPNHAWWDRAAFGDVGTISAGSRPTASQ
jgi:hypothetical protein